MGLVSYVAEVSTGGAEAGLTNRTGTNASTALTPLLRKRLHKRIPISLRFNNPRIPRKFKFIRWIGS